MKRTVFNNFIFLFFLLSFETSFLFAQENFDSLRIQLSQAVEDTNKVNLLNRLAWDLRSISPQEAMDDAELAKSLSLRLGFDKGTGNSYNNMGVIHYRRGEYVEAIKNHLQALTIRENSGDKDGVALSRINLGNVYSEQNNNELALEQYREAEKLLVQTGNQKRLLFVYLNISAIFLAENKFEDGLPYCIKAKVFAQKQNDKVVEAEAWNNIGVVKENENKLNEALSAYQHAFSISKAIDDKTSMVDNMMNIGDIYRLQKKYAAAEEWHYKTEILAREIGYLEGLRVLYENLSKDYQEEKNFELALQFHIRFKELNDSLFNADNVSKINALTEKWNDDRAEKNLIKKQTALFETQFLQRQNSLYTWTISSCALLLFIFGSYFFYAKRKLKNAAELIQVQQEKLARNRKRELVDLP